MADRFELLQKLGSGGMGTVWKARDLQIGDIVALKLLHEQYADDPYFLQRFEREVDVTRRVKSPHVVEMRGYGIQGGRPYVAMELVEGESLKDLVRRRGKLPWEEAKELLRQIALGLAAAHEAGVIHRDVKPSNVLVTPEGQAKLVDFGVAKAADMTALTGAHTTFGTAGYMAPEGKASVQADLYALGCVAYEMLTGGPVFTGDTQGEVLVKHIREEPDLSRLPVEARPVVGWLLEKEPGDRAVSAAALMGVLEGSTRGTLGKPVGTDVRRKRIVLAGILGLPMMVLAGLGVFFAASGDGGDDPNAGSAVDANDHQATSAPSAVQPSPSPTERSLPLTKAPSESPTAPPSPLVSPSPTSTSTATPAATQGPTTPTSTAIPTSTPTPTPSLTPTPTPSPTPSEPIQSITDFVSGVNFVASNSDGSLSTVTYEWTVNYVLAGNPKVTGVRFIPLESRSPILFLKPVRQSLDQALEGTHKARVTFTFTAEENSRLVGAMVCFSATDNPEFACSMFQVTPTSGTG